jgi:hypothetical protein
VSRLSFELNHHSFRVFSKKKFIVELRNLVSMVETCLVKIMLLPTLVLSFMLFCCILHS